MFLPDVNIYRYLTGRGIQISTDRHTDNGAGYRVKNREIKRVIYPEIKNQVLLEENI